MWQNIQRYLQMTWKQIVIRSSNVKRPVEKRKELSKTAKRLLIIMSTGDSFIIIPRRSHNRFGGKSRGELDFRIRDQSGREQRRKYYDQSGAKLPSSLLAGCASRSSERPMEVPWFLSRRVLSSRSHLECKSVLRERRFSYGRLWSRYVEIWR